MINRRFVFALLLLLITGCETNSSKVSEFANYGRGDVTYAEIVSRAIRANIIFNAPIMGNPVAQVEIRTFSDGGIVGRKLLVSSGNEQWDTAVLRAIDRTRDLPRDTDGKVPSPMIVSLRPKN